MKAETSTCLGHVSPTCLTRMSTWGGVGVRSADRGSVRLRQMTFTGNVVWAMAGRLDAPAGYHPVHETNCEPFQSPALNPAWTVNSIWPPDLFSAGRLLKALLHLSLIHISEPTRLGMISY